MQIVATFKEMSDDTTANLTKHSMEVENNSVGPEVGRIGFVSVSSFYWRVAQHSALLYSIFKPQG